MKGWHRGALVLALVLAVGRPATADTFRLATLEGSQEVPPVASAGTGSATVALNAAETQITVNASFTGLTGTTTAAHIHGPGPRGVNAAAIFQLTLVPLGATSGTVTNNVFAVSPAQVADFKAGLWYVNVHTTQYPGGEIRGQLDAATPVPAMSPWGLIALGTMLALLGLLGLTLAGRRLLATG